MSLVSPMTTPSPSLLGSRKNSMTSLSSLVSSASTIGELRTGSHSSKTSSICGSLADGTSPFKQQNAMNGGAHINHYNATATTHPTEKHNILQNGHLNGNSMLIQPNDSGDFHSLQFQIDDNQPRIEMPVSTGLRPGSSQSFTMTTANRRPSNKGKTFWTIIHDTEIFWSSYYSLIITLFIFI